jgi:hypothetical protein
MPYYVINFEPISSALGVLAQESLVSFAHRLRTVGSYRSDPF